MGNSPLSADESWSRISSRIRYCLSLLESVTLRPPTMGELPVQEAVTGLVLGELLTLIAGIEVVHMSDDPGWRMACRHFKVPTGCSWSSDLGLTQEGLTERLSFWIVASLDHHRLLDVMAPDLSDEALGRIVRDALVRAVMSC